MLSTPSNNVHRNIFLINLMKIQTELKILIIKSYHFYEVKTICVSCHLTTNTGEDILDQLNKNSRWNESNLLSMKLKRNTPHII